MREAGQKAEDEEEQHFCCQDGGDVNVNGCAGSGEILRAASLSKLDEGVARRWKWSDEVS